MYHTHSDFIQLLFETSAQISTQKLLYLARVTIYGYFASATAVKYVPGVEQGVQQSAGEPGLCHSLSLQFVDKMTLRSECYVTGFQAAEKKKNTYAFVTVPSWVFLVASK